MLQHFFDMGDKFSRSGTGYMSSLIGMMFVSKEKISYYAWMILNGIYSIDTLILMYKIYT